ncbi:porin [Metallosphaera tengchongensis]|uniref:Porin n=1 Tax=Metallosphaera tengchongensis TaxID=1532350 RepID=A0A6N0NWU2_9CREN|nr:sterol desaturase family protein [Metallosphaera tengchongensis]QKR00665.1 porin [Metallosphaera tengchongensis]
MAVYLIIQLVAIGVGVFVGMEFLARLMHKYVMHGVLWSVHSDHHREKHGEVEKNDAFGALFAGVAIFLVIEWLRGGDPILLAIAMGMTGYGIAYAFVHDMIIHDRHLHLRAWGMRHSPFRELILVHDVHHQEGEGNWGFLFIIRGLDKVPEEARYRS